MNISDVLDDNLPPETLSCSPIKLMLDHSHQGSALVRFTLETRHVCTAIPLNERKSYRINLEWLVISSKRGRPIGIITQSDHSYRHPDIIVDLPLDSELVLVPASPYICNSTPKARAEIHTLDLGPHAYRYVLEVGSATDSGIVRNNWSYREGRLAFEHWFHNKMFRWSFDGAELVLPATRGCALWISMNALCRTTVDVYVGSHKVGRLHPIANWARWHDEFYGFAVPANIVTDNFICLTFRYTRPNDVLIDFNLRQSYFAVSKVTVDIFGQSESGIVGRVMQAGWHGDLLQLEPDPTERRPLGFLTTQAALVIPQVEFDLLEIFFAPHSAFWTTLRGASKGFKDAGVSVSVVAAASLRPTAYDTLILGPLRFLAEDVESACGSQPNVRGALFTLTTASFLSLGAKVDDALLQTISYREIFDVSLPSGQRGNFWEFILDESLFDQTEIGWAGYVLLGRPRGSTRLWLISASAEEAIEMGDPHAKEVLDCFIKATAACSFGFADEKPCTFSIVGDELEMSVPEHQVGLRSYGGGIARGWRSTMSEIPLFPAKRNEIRLDHARLPQRGKVAAALHRLASEVDGLTLISGSKLLIKFEAPFIED